jgi:hypothetical protein
MLPTADSNLTTRIRRFAGLGGLVWLAALLLVGFAAAPLSASPAPFEGRLVNLLPRDVDGDRDVDLVVTMLSGEHVGVWLNDGDGVYEEDPLGEYPAWVWLPLPEFGARAPGQAAADTVAAEDDLPALGPAASPQCELRCGDPAPSGRAVASPWRVPLHDCIRPPPFRS